MKNDVVTIPLHAPCDTDIAMGIIDPSDCNDSAVAAGTGPELDGALRNRRIEGLLPISLSAAGKHQTQCDK